MNELIKIEQRGGIETVNARELWEKLESKQEFANWIKGRLDGFIEDTEYLVEKIINNPNGGRPFIDYHLTIDTAKHVAMLERNDKGREIRQYFIDVENAVKSRPVNQFDMMRQMIQIAEDQSKRLTIIEAKLETSQMDFFTIAAYCSLRGRKVDVTQANIMGRKAVKLSKENGYDIGKVNDPRYGTVHTYHTDILARVVR